MFTQGSYPASDTGVKALGMFGAPGVMLTRHIVFYMARETACGCDFQSCFESVG